MEISYFLAQVIGATLFAIGVGLLFNGKYYHKVFKQFMGEGPLYFLGGWMVLPVGITLVLFHNYWNGPWWVVLITVFSWAILLKGVILFVAPEWMQSVGKSWIKKKEWIPWVGVLYAAVGAALGYYGFFY